MHELSSAPAPTPVILDRELSGNKINGGMITNFSSVGIVDEAKKQILTVHNDGITVDKATIRVLEQPVTVKGSLNVNGEITAQKLHVDEITADVRNERTNLFFDLFFPKLHLICQLMIAQSWLIHIFQ